VIITTNNKTVWTLLQSYQFHENIIYVIKNYIDINNSILIFSHIFLQIKC